MKDLYNENFRLPKLWRKRLENEKASCSPESVQLILHKRPSYQKVTEQLHPNQNTNNILHINILKNQKIHMEPEKTSDQQSKY